jgi:uncharacterized protein (TIGR02246 family)
MSGSGSDDPAQIRELLASYALALDAGDTDGCVELFAEDAEFVVYGRAYAGRAGIGKMFGDAPHGLHLTGASRIDVDGDTATARTQVLFVRAGDLHLRPALYDDELVLRGGQWRFGRRRCRFVTTHGLSDTPGVP